MTFAALPPEINSGRMYSGPGSGSMLAAATAWDELAADLHTTAICYESVISGLISGPWLGASSSRMAAATAPLMSWLHATADQAGQAAVQARSAVAAYESAYAMTVHPALIAANRTQLMTLMATNVLGQNTPAIAATEAQYGEMWAQDVAAMYGYAAASAAATSLTPFSPPPQTANPAGPAGLATAVTKAGGAAAATEITTALEQLTSTVPSVLAMAGGSILEAPEWVEDLAMVMNVLSTPFFVSTTSAGLMTSFVSTVKSMVPMAGTVGAGLLESVGPAATGALGPVSLTGAVSAGLGKAASVGALSVPKAWAAAAPTLSSA